MDRYEYDEAAARLRREQRRRQRKREILFRRIRTLTIACALTVAAMAAAKYYGLLPGQETQKVAEVLRQHILPQPEDEYYTPSTVDYDGDGLEDYADMVSGIRAYFDTAPYYDGKYYDGGYPDDGHGVCTDVLWQGFQAAGYDLKALVDADIAENRDAYPCVETVDPNIDFRHVDVLHCFFSRYAAELSCDLEDPTVWQAGDIVIFADDQHIAVCSDRRNESGIPILLHHGGKYSPYPREEDDIYDAPVTAHFRWPG